jgi:hypothetical protein
MLLLKDTHPAIASQFDEKQNPEINLDTLTTKSNKKVWWICNEGKCSCIHSWQTSVCNRTRIIKNKKSNSGCPWCLNRIFCEHNSLAGRFPEIVHEWSSKNKLKPTEVSAASSEKVIWVCNKNTTCDCPHEWIVAPVSRISRNNSNKENHITGCPFCARNIFCKHNSFKAKAPKKFLEQWHPTKNLSLKPYELSLNSHTIVWWKCREKGHEWQATCHERISRNSGCPYCTNRRIDGNNSFAVAYPKMVKYWSKKNEKGPETYAPSTKKIVWWICEKGHEYQMSIEMKGKLHCGCPDCPKKHYSFIAIEWLKWIQKAHPYPIQHAKNEGEFRIPNTKYAADGYCKTTNTVFEFFGDLYHGNPEKYNPDDEFKLNPNKTYGQLYQKTLDKISKIRELGYNLVFIWESEWNAIKSKIDFDKKIRAVNREENYWTDSENSDSETDNDDCDSD